MPDKKVLTTEDIGINLAALAKAAAIEIVSAGHSILRET